ncbi:MAG: dynamin family protein [Pseudomonadota bacterium]
MPELTTQVANRLKNLEAHLAEENEKNPTLLKAVQSFRSLDQVAYRLHILDRDQSYATRVSWWPMVAVLGTYSAGKSTFINYVLDADLQRTGNQAIDDKFTVITYSSHDEVKTLPGVALDGDPRFPFFQISQSIEEVAASGPQRIDAYLQLKTCPSDALKGKILIDSPGFDADSQRAATLRLTNHIIDLSDIVLIFFDARHPEPGAMQDTLNHLVAETIERADSNKFLYILNQMDITAREDNPEEIVAAWQRALAQAGLTTGRFYRIYNPKAAVEIEDPTVKARYEEKRDADLSEITERLQHVEVERAYRIVGSLEKTAKDIHDVIVPKLSELIGEWRGRVFKWDAITIGTILLLTMIFLSASSLWGTVIGFFSDEIMLVLGLVVLAVGFGYLHSTIRRWVANSIIQRLPLEITDPSLLAQISQAFQQNTSIWPKLSNTPLGWNKATRGRIDDVLTEANQFVQSLNDQFANPSGKGEEAAESAETNKPAVDEESA